LDRKKLADPEKAAAAKGAKKAAPEEVAFTKARPPRQARTPSSVPPEAEHPLPNVGPEELELFLPERVATAEIGDSPEDLFARLEAHSPEERAAVVCLDAREEPNLDAVLAWLKKFDAVAAEQYEDDTEAPYEPHRVVFLSEAAPPVLDEWSTRADLDWVRTEDKSDDISPLYRRYLQDDLRDFVSGDLEGFFPKRPVGKAERLADRIPASKQEAWKARVQMFQNREDEA
jgi:hypothetical protein